VTWPVKELGPRPILACTWSTSVKARKASHLAHYRPARDGAGLFSCQTNSNGAPIPENGSYRATVDDPPRLQPMLQMEDAVWHSWRSRPRNEAFSSAPQTDRAPCARPASRAASFACPKPSSSKLLFGASAARRSPSCFRCPSKAMRSSITTYQESISWLAGEVDEAAAEEVPAPMTPTRSGDSAYTPSSSGRR
jgi:hypothetical protein